MKISSKHPKLDKIFSFLTFNEGYTEETDASFLSVTQLSDIMNMKYVISTNDAGQQKISIRKRQGTTIISNSALPSGADVMACTYYISQSKYILATSSKIYYLDASLDPVEIGSLDGIPTFTEFNGKLIIHDSGITKYWDGTNYGKIVKSFEDEVLATGDGATTEFSGTLNNPALEPSTLSISFTNTTSKTITEDGAGRLTGDVDSSWVKTVTGAADNGSGLIRLTVVAHGFSNGDEVNVQGVNGTTEANNSSSNPTWSILGHTADTIDLYGSTFANAYTSGGTVSKNAISSFTTGAYKFKTDGAPDNSTSVTADYDKTDGCAKSKAGLVRGSRLYMWGDADNPSRLTYTEVNDEKATDTSSGGGYLDIDPSDGYDLLGGLNFETSLLMMKENSLHRIDAYPGDSDFRAEKLTDDLGTIAHRSPLFEGDIVSFVAKEGWVAMSPSQRYGDIQKGIPISKNFSTKMSKYTNSAAYTAFNQIDKQLWLALSTNGSTTYLEDIYVANLATGGQISKYKFKFGHSCFNFVNNMMLIGGVDGNLYKLDHTNTVFTDNSVSYTDTTYAATGFLDWETTNYLKHNAKIFLDVIGGGGASFNLDLYRNGNYVSFLTISINVGSSWDKIYNVTTKIADTTGKIGQLVSDLEFKRRFNFETLMAKISDVAGNVGVEIRSITFKASLLGKI